jgi:hypothetical protein
MTDKAGDVSVVVQSPAPARSSIERDRPLPAAHHHQSGEPQQAAQRLTF